MHHGLTYFPCRNILVGIFSSSLLIFHLILHDYSSPSLILLSSNNTKNILHTTSRYSLFKKCPLTNYNFYGIQYQHGTRLCSGYTYNIVSQNDI